MNAIDSMASYAHSQARKMSKQSAQDYIKKLVGNDEDMAQKLAPLYKFFMPAIPAKPKTHWQWVAKAMGVRDVRSYINRVEVTKDHIIATDGHRMHVCRNDEQLEPGAYNAACDKIEYDGKFPDWQRLLRSTSGNETVEIDIAFLPVRDLGSFGFAYEIVLKDGTTMGLNKKYIDEVLSMNNGIATAYVVNKHASVIFDFDDGRQAVVMPAKL